MPAVRTVTGTHPITSTTIWVFGCCPMTHKADRQILPFTDAGWGPNLSQRRSSRAEGLARSIQAKYQIFLLPPVITDRSRCDESWSRNPSLLEHMSPPFPHLPPPRLAPFPTCACESPLRRTSSCSCCCDFNCPPLVEAACPRPLPIKNLRHPRICANLRFRRFPPRPPSSVFCRSSRAPSLRSS